jgi:superfamily II DNA or RNA helicase
MASTNLTEKSTQLRPYQLDLITKIEEQWDLGHRKVLAQLPTGGGKVGL